MRPLEKKSLNRIATVLQLDKKKMRSNLDFLKEIRKGFSTKIVNDFCSELHLSQHDLAKSLSINPRTLARRKTEKRLHADESDKFYRLALILSLAIEVLEDEQQAVQWLLTPKKVLGGEIPLSLLDTEAGAREIEDLLGRIEYSVYS